ncbi:MAG: hypothetical protein MJ231_00675 [bacterium]|nr:hypothetical protein [bacterium]
MRIYNVNSINFGVQKAVVPTKIMKNDINLENLYKERFYNNIQKYLENYDKQTYFKNFSEDLENLKNCNKGQYTPLEQKYINDLRKTLDLADEIDKIPDKYLTEKMQKLLGKNL